MKIEVKPTDFWGEAVYTVFVDGKEVTSQYHGELPVFNRDDAEEIAEEIRQDYEDAYSLGDDGNWHP